MIDVMYRGLVTCLLVACVSPVLAVGPDELPEVEVFISGSSAQDESLENLMRLESGVPGMPNLCEEGSLSIYRGTIDGVRKRVFYCRTSEHVGGLPAGTRLAVHKSSGGSGEGVAPVATRTPVAFINMASLPRGERCRKPSPVLNTGNLAAYSDHRDCSGSSKVAVPLAGISDIEPGLIEPVAEPLETRPMSQLVWGLPVTKNFRNALQAIQGKVPAEVPHDHPSRETEAAMPSLGHAQIASIFAGTIGSWSQLLDGDGTPLPDSGWLPEDPPAAADLAGTSPGAYRPDPVTGRPVYVCRRIATSGTQAAYEIHYLRARCLADAPEFVRPDDSSDILAGGDAYELLDRPDPAGRVFAGTGSSDVRACLDAHEQHNRWAIGMFSTEVRGNNASREFRHIRVDGFAPTLANAREGRWLHVSEPTIQWRAADSDTLMTTAEGRVLEFIVTHIGQPRVVESLNSSFRHPWGQGGYLALAGLGIGLESDPNVAGLSKTFRGRVRNCNVPLLMAPSRVDFTEPEQRIRSGGR